MYKLLVLLPFGTERTVGECPYHFVPLCHEALCFAVRHVLHEPLPHILYRLGRGVCHVVGIEAVVAQLIHHDLVGREVVHPVREAAA